MSDHTVIPVLELHIDDATGIATRSAVVCLTCGDRVRPRGRSIAGTTWRHTRRWFRTWAVRR